MISGSRRRVAGLRTVEDLLEYELCALYDAEHKTMKAMARLESKCEDPALLEALKQHQAQSQDQVGRVDDIFAISGIDPQRKPCAGLNGMVEEFSDFLELGPSQALIDMFAVESVRRIERHLVCGYQALITLTVALRMDEVTELAARTMNEHHATGERFKGLSITLTEKVAG